ncbi:DUF5335 family protein [Bdellovibrio sp. HCB337]|uniref:DUF5335 family protein n=1 Tax=Bdellovibrio sp. HCB337 TaxID=3394358 RepID=UPI0039A72775
MITRTVQKSEWNKFFNLVSKSIEGQEVEIEVSGLEIGDQIEADWVPFDGISYDPKTDYIFVHTPLLDHTIVHPSTVLVAEEENTIVAINITDDETIQILQFRPSLEIPQERRAELENRP